jgi:alkyl hydroperoxide reductase subunit F
MLDNQLKDQLKVYLEKLKKRVDISFSSDGSATALEMETLLNEVADLSPLVFVTQGSDDIKLRPSFTMNSPDNDARVTFAGIPMGHEFTSFVLALLQIGGHPPNIDAELIEQIKSLNKTLHFDSYISLSCMNCPDVVQALNLLAIFNPNISHTMVDGAAFPDEVSKRNIMSVPAIYLNNQEFAVGRMTLREILALVDTESTSREVQKISEKEPFDVLIIGGGAAAAAAAIYSARKGIRTGLVTENIGGQMLNTTTIENIIALKETEGVRFSAELEDNIRHNGVDIMMPHRVDKLIPGDLIEIRTESGATLRTKTAILAPGSRFRLLNIPGESEHIGRGVAFCAHCDGPLYKNRKVAVIGSGNGAAEAVIDLAGIAEHVTLFIRGDQSNAETILLEKMNRLPNVTIKLNSLPTEIIGDGTKVYSLSYHDKKTDITHSQSVDGIFIQVGQQPATNWLDSTIDLNQNGEIMIDNYGRTSLQGVFAAGDATTIPYKQIIIAMGSGATAALSAFDYLIRSR